MEIKFAIFIVIIILILRIESQQSQADAAELAKSGQFHNIFSSLKQASHQGVNYVSDLVVSIPFGKIVLAGGALLSLFFIFVRLLVVLGPILLLGALTRDSTDATDLLRMLIEFYNQVIVALDEQMTQPGQPQAA